MCIIPDSVTPRQLFQLWLNTTPPTKRKRAKRVFKRFVFAAEFERSLRLGEQLPCMENVNLLLWHQPTGD